jgi:enediyne biosynthesis protein E4
LNALGEGALEPATKLVLQSIGLRLSPRPVAAVRASLEHAAALAPDDDRVWLGRANLAIRAGAYDEAQTWLDACRKRRPDDVPVWESRLEWGMATDRIDVVKEAMTHVTDLQSRPGRFHQVNAWLAKRQGDVATERRELAMSIAADPADVKSLARLAELAERDRQADRAAELVRMKAEIEQSLARYRKLYDRKQPLRDARELARLAEQLGHRFVARAFLTIAVSDDPARADLRQQLHDERGRISD